MASGKSAIVIVGILLFSSLIPLTTYEIQDELDELDIQFGGSYLTNMFVNGVSETGTVGDAIGLVVPLKPGYEADEMEFDIDLTPNTNNMSESFTVAASSLNGTHNFTTFDSGRVVLETQVSGPPQAGNSSLQLFNTVSWSGTHNYDTLELRCGIQSCGKIIATGDLTIYANRVIVEQGTSILADDVTSGGIGAGSSTTTSSSGRNDGGGGGGHGGTGGAGGGSAGGSGGSSYGNATEAGSEGGSVTSSYHATSNGGLGGGYIKIISGTVTVNGTIEADGGDGDNGNPPSGGTGAGSSGGGGGSGGTVRIESNSVNIGNFGKISANGGNGGNGANGVQNGAGFGMYDGGDGGGGGAGGRIHIATQSNSYSNQGTVQVNAGNGGTKGLKYGTGSDGVDGSAGNVGVITTTNWSGFQSLSNSTAYDGTFTSNPILVNFMDHSMVHLTHQVMVPSQSSVLAQYRYTLNGDDTSFADWSEWTDCNLAGEMLPRLTWIQVMYTFNRTALVEPSVSGFSLESELTSSISDIRLEYNAQVIDFDLINNEIAPVEISTVTPGTTSTVFSFDLIDGASLMDNSFLWFDWDIDTAMDTYTVELEGTNLASGDLVNSATGVDLQIDTSVANPIINNLPLTQGANPVKQVNIYFNTTTPVQWEFNWFRANWQFSSRAEFTASYNSMVINECGSYYLSTGISCLGSASSHPLTLSGLDGMIPTGSSTTYEISNARFGFSDSFAPEVDSFETMKGGVSNPTLRVGDSFAVIIYDRVGETNLNVSVTGQLSGTEAEFTIADTLSYNANLGGYYFIIDTSELELDSAATISMSFSVSDHVNNVLSPDPSYQVSIYPSIPEVADLIITPGDSTTMVSGNVMDGSWEVENAEFDFTIYEAKNRSNLGVSITLTSLEHSQVNLVATWDETEMAYITSWDTSRAQIGLWELEINMADTVGLMDSDEDGLQSGYDARIRLSDYAGPEITSIDYLSEVEIGDELYVNFTWAGQAEESVSGVVRIMDGSEVVQQRSILPTTDSQATVVFTTMPSEPGIYTLDYTLMDDTDNLAFEAVPVEHSVTVLSPWVTLDETTSISKWNATSVAVTGDVAFRNTAGVLTLTNDEGATIATQNISDGQFELTFDIMSYLEPQIDFIAQFCDVESDSCQEIEMSVDYYDTYMIDVDAMCFYEKSFTYSEMAHVVVECRVINNGHTSVDVSFNEISQAHYNSTASTLDAGEETVLYLNLSAGEIAINETLAWGVVAVNTLEASEVISSDSITVIREEVVDNEEPTGSTGDGNEGQDGGSNSVVLIALVVVLIAAVVGFMLIRGRGEEVVNDMVEQMHDNLVEDSPVVEEQAIASSEPAVIGHPHSSEPATSSDENGYEWLNKDGVDYYRLANSGSEWYKFEN